VEADRSRDRGSLTCVGLTAAFQYPFLISGRVHVMLFRGCQVSGSHIIFGMRDFTTPWFSSNIMVLSL
jgi:hypothetical protein